MYPENLQQAQKALALARDEARLLAQREVGTAHLLLGVLREGNGLEEDILGSLCLDRERVRTLTLHALRQEPERG